jgi:4-amino-4-deoxy-L-arabinose transferase-like glycosyltransferase
VKRFSSRAEAVIALAAGGVLLHSAASLAGKAWAYLCSPYARDYGEGCVLMMVQLLDQRLNYFVTLRDYPFIHANYPPVFIALVWPFYRLFGPSLLAPRLLSILATVGLLAVMYPLLHRLGGSRRQALALTGLAACPWFVQTWAPMGRVDMLAFLLSIAGLLAFVRQKPAYVVFPLFWLAFFTKQNALLAPAAVLVHLLCEFEPRRFLRSLAGFALPLAAIFGLLNLATHGGLFRHLITYTAAAEYEWGRMLGEYLAFAWNAWPILLIVFAAGPLAFGRGAARLFFIYWLLNMAALSTIAKAGAAQNYAIEPWLATVLLAAVALPVVAARSTLPREWAMGALLIMAAVASYTGHYSGGLPDYFDQSSAQANRLPQAITHPERAADFQKLWAAVRAENGPILSENVAALVVNGKPVLVEPHGIMLLVKTGFFDPAEIVRDCEVGRFTLVVAERRFEETPGFGDCLRRRYRPTETLGPYRLLRPRPRE